MLKITIKTRGKLYKLPDGEVIRSPRVLYRRNTHKRVLLSFFNVLNLESPRDFEIENVEEEDLEQIPETTNIKRYTRIKNDAAGISVGGKIGKKI